MAKWRLICSICLARLVKYCDLTHKPALRDLECKPVYFTYCVIGMMYDIHTI
jgi:hypothetical protein